MKPTISNLGAILYSPSQYVIPVFQRHYRWEEPQWEKLWENLTELRQHGRTGAHFMGFLVFVPGLAQPGKNTTFHLVDGQQRLTTLDHLFRHYMMIIRPPSGYQPHLSRKCVTLKTSIATCLTF